MMYTIDALQWEIPVVIDMTVVCLVTVLKQMLSDKLECIEKDGKDDCRAIK